MRHYRYVTHYSGTVVSAMLETFNGYKETPKGWWVLPTWLGEPRLWSERVLKQHRRWVSKTSRKRYCYPTQEEAWESYQTRCAYRVMHLERDLMVAKAAQQLEEPGATARTEEDIFEGML